jgi:hypothetical protein
MKSRDMKTTEGHGREQAVGCPQRSEAHRASWPLPSLPGRTRRLQSPFEGGRPEGPGDVILRGGLRRGTGERMVMSNSWPRRGRTTIATGDQREPVVTDGNVPVPGGGECVGATRATVVRPLRGRGASSLFHGFRCTPPVATVVCPLWGQEGGGLSQRKGQSGDWRAQERPRARHKADAASCRVLPAPWRGPKTKEAGHLLYVVCSLWGKDGRAGA